ncbi:MAG: hypothetical protein QME49_04825 [bacterium]|nr:hypothetical protein [bacterium]
MEIKLGMKGRDKVTGFEGIITGVADYLYGCKQIVLTPVANDGKMSDNHWFDIGRIEVIGQGIAPEAVMADKPGGPNRDEPNDKVNGMRM